jgi:hypothetical protein
MIATLEVLWTTALVPSLLVVNCATAAFLGAKIKNALTTHLSRGYKME